MECIKKTAIVAAFSFTVFHKPRKHLETIGIRLEHVLGILLLGVAETLVGHSSSFDEAVGGRQPSKLNLSVLHHLGEIFRKFPLISLVFFDKVV